MKKLLVVVDYQNDFVSPDGAVAQKLGSERVERGTALSSTIQELVDVLSAEKQQILFIMADYNLENYSGTYLENRRNSSFGNIAMKGTWGHELYELTPPDNSHFITKHYFDGYYQTDLDSYLENLKPDEVYFAGINTDVCVFHTALNTIIRDYTTYLIEDATAAVSSNKDLFMGYMTSVGIKLRQSKDLMTI